MRPPGLCRWEWREFCNRSSFRPVMGFIVMTILNRLKSAKAGLGVLCLGVALFNSAVLTTKNRQTILHSSIDIMPAADIMDMDENKAKDREECSISRILSVRRPRFRESSNYKISKRFERARRLQRDATSVLGRKRLLTKIRPSPTPRTPTSTERSIA